MWSILVTADFKPRVRKVGRRCGSSPTIMGEIEVRGQRRGEIDEIRIEGSCLRQVSGSSKRFKIARSGGGNSLMSKRGS
jgi:hypothetical protein